MTIRNILCAVAVVLVLAAVTLLGGQSRSEAKAGRWDHISVVDGDTIEIDGRRVDLFGIDAPERDQTCMHNGNAYECGLDAAYSLQKVIALSEKRPFCEDEGMPSRKPALVCFADHENLSLLMLMRGYAVALPEAPFEYQEKQDQARFAGLGLWRGSFQSPAQWRRQHGGAEAIKPLD